MKAAAEATEKRQEDRRKCRTHGKKEERISAAEPGDLLLPVAQCAAFCKVVLSIPLIRQNDALRGIARDRPCRRDVDVTMPPHLIDRGRPATRFDLDQET